MSLADLERSLLARLEASGEPSELRSRAREAALREFDGLCSSLATSKTKPTTTTNTRPPPPPTPPAETVVALELVREFLDFHGFLKARSLLEAEADLPPCRGAELRAYSLGGGRWRRLLGSKGRKKKERKKVTIETGFTRRPCFIR